MVAKKRPSPHRKGAKASARRAAPAKKGDKNPSIALLISAAGFLLLFGASALGYFYLGQRRKGLLYLLINWGLTIALVTLFILTFISFPAYGFGLICAGPLAVLVLVFDLLVLYDIYQMAQRRTPLLPHI